MGSCLPWLLFVSFIVLGVSGGLASLWAYFNVSSGEDPDRQVTNNYHYAKGSYSNDSRQFVIYPGGVNAVASLVLALACLFSRKIFSSTVVVNTAVCLFVVNLVIAVLYQCASVKLYGNDQELWQNFMAISGFHVGQLLLITLQILMAGIEVRQQKVAWPTINFSHILTFSLLFLIVIIPLLVYSVILMCVSQIMQGMIVRTPEDQLNTWNNPRERYPDYYVFSCAVVLIYGGVVIFESLLSLLMGKVHMKMMGITCLLSGFMYCYVAVMSSHSVMMMIAGQKILTYGTSPMGFALATGLLSILYGILCLALPKKMASPPKFVRNIAAVISEISQITLSKDNLMLALKSNANLPMKTTLASLCFLSLAISSLGYNTYRPYNGILVITGDLVILSRLLPSILNTLYTQEEETDTLKIFLHLTLEVILTIFGIFASISTCAVHLISGVIKLPVLMILVNTGYTTPGIKDALATLVKDMQHQKSEDIQYVKLQTNPECEDENTMPPSM